MFRSAKAHFIIGLAGLAAGAACLAQGTAGQGIAANGSIEIDVAAPAAVNEPETPQSDEHGNVKAGQSSIKSVAESGVGGATDFVADPGGLDAIPTVGPFRPDPKFREPARPGPRQDATGSATATNELKSLGMPNGSLSVRPSAEGEPESGVIGKLDPRTNDITRVVGALAAVIGLLLLLKSVLKKVGGGVVSAPRPSGVVEVLARYPIARGQQLMLLKLARRILLLHQNGSALITLSEISETNEVAGILSRLEAGSSQRDAAKFRSVLEEFAAEHEKSSDRGAKKRVNLPLGDAEIVDLTRQSNRGLRGLLSLGGLW